MLRKPLFYLLAALMLFGGGIILRYLKGDYYNSQAFYSQVVEDRIEEELRELEYAMTPVLDTVSTTAWLRFGHLRLLHDTPYFIYRQGKLMVWSDYHFVPEHKQVAGDFNLSVLQQEKSLYLMRKWVMATPTGRYEVVALLPLYQAYPLQNKYLREVANPRIFLGHRARLLTSEEEKTYPLKVRGRVMLYLADDPGFVFEHSPFNHLLLTLYMLALVLLIVAGTLAARYYATQRGPGWLLAWLLIVWVGLKLMMAFTGFPEGYFDSRLFDPRFFTVSWFERHYADMLLNTLMLLLIAVVLFRYYRAPAFRPAGRAGGMLAAAPVVVVLLHLVMNYQYLQLRSLYFNSQISLDITHSLAFDTYRLLTLVVFVLTGATTAIIFHWLIRRYEAWCPGRNQRALSLALGTGLYVLFTLLVDLPVGNLLPVTLTLILVLLWSGIHRTLQQLSQGITLYLLLWLVVLAGTGGWSISGFEQTRQTNRMVRFAQNLAARHDYLAEFMMARAVQAIKADPSLASRLGNPFLSKDFIIKKIEKKYLPRYLDKYQVSVFLYNQKGDALPGYGTAAGYFDIRQRYALPENKTEYPDIFLISQDLRDLSRHYVAFVPMERYGRQIGYLILDFRQKRYLSQRVYPELMIDHRFADYPDSEFAYAIFEGNVLVRSSGEMDYRYLDLQQARRANPWYQGGYKHYLLSDSRHDTIVVSVQVRLLWQVLTNITFLFAALMLPVILVLAFFLIRRYRQGEAVTYTLKIQLFLNLAFILPLILVTATTLSFITRSFRQAQLDNKLEEARRLAGQIDQETDAVLLDRSAVDLLHEKLQQLAGYGRFDASVYGTDGRLITSTHAGIFTMGLQSEYLNPHAFIRLVERLETSVVEQEHIGRLNYFTSYVAIRSAATNRLLGILALPFFGAEKMIEASQREALAVILNVFVLVFILALLATFQTSRWLTAPLRLIREKMRETSFTGRNQPIDWHSEDEIGELIKEYNRMLEKLEESREALARTQKESAWREVAQQVAHEIKNPLTPMKLTLQKLELAVARGSRPQEELVATVKNLLAQLQMLSDIVTSFSEFAKMPMPRIGRIELTAVLREVESLMAGDDGISLELQLPAGPVFIRADAKLMSRIFANIIINAGQSARPGQDKVQVQISMEVNGEEQTVRLAFSDDGTGIPEEVRDRVFIPRFSTKKEGSGIGLAVARHGVEQVGGTIWFETETGRGTTFYLQFPLVD